MLRGTLLLKVLALGAAGLFSGLALVVTILTRGSLLVALASTAVLAAALVLAALLRLPPATRALMGGRALRGLCLGLAATAAYDGVRWLLITAFPFQVHPFDTFRIFGQLLTGQASGPLPWVVGTAYHYLNGVTFAVSFAVTLGGRSWLWGLVWAFGLEAFMLTLYPGWLHIRQIYLQEFTVISMAGHLAYGTTLGLLSRRFLTPLRLRSKEPLPES